MYVCIYVFMFILVSEPEGGLISFYMAWKAFSNIRTDIKKTIVAKTTSDLTFAVQSLSHVQLIHNFMDCSIPGFQALHYIPEFAQIHVHWVNDAIQTSHVLLPPSPPALNLSQHQGLFQWVGTWDPMARELELPF